MNDVLVRRKYWGLEKMNVVLCREGARVCYVWAGSVDNNIYLLMFKMEHNAKYIECM